jgi:hypothetical protein
MSVLAVDADRTLATTLLQWLPGPQSDAGRPRLRARRINADLDIITGIDLDESTLAADSEEFEVGTGSLAAFVRPGPGGHS